MRKLKVLIVDDSLFFREVLTMYLKQDLPPGSLIESAGDPFEARDKIMAFWPDIMLLDIEMPRMDGVEFLKKLLAQYDQPTIVMTSEPKYRSIAIAAGARDFIVKDTHRAPAEFSRELCRLIERVITAREGDEDEPAEESSEEPALPERRGPIRLIALGASTGGTEALATVIHGLTPPLPPIVIVQHIPAGFSQMFAGRLNRESELTAAEGIDGEHLKDNHIYLAPGGKHMRVQSFGGVLSIDVKHGPTVNGHCPSVDVLFDSVARSLGKNAIGAIFTGMGADGAKGLLHMREAGAHTLGQDEASCVVYGMPRAAYELGAVERQLPLKAFSGAITTLARD